MAENMGFEASFGCFICDSCDSDLKLRKTYVCDDALDCHFGNGIAVTDIRWEFKYETSI